MRPPGGSPRSANTRTSPLFVAYYLATWDSHWKMITDFMPLEDFYKTDLHRLALGPLGINHQIFGVLGVLDGTGYAIAINRTHQGFTERERELLNVIQPHLVTSFINAAACCRAQCSISQIPGGDGHGSGRVWLFRSAGQGVMDAGKSRSLVGGIFRR